MGDFDSIDKQILKKYKDLKSNIKGLIPEKDFTDTEAALNLAIKLTVTEVTIIGGIRNKVRPYYSKCTYIERSIGKQYKSSNSR